jgi:hypothetical protein
MIKRAHERERDHIFLSRVDHGQRFARSSHKQNITQVYDDETNKNETRHRRTTNKGASDTLAGRGGRNRTAMPRSWCLPGAAAAAEKEEAGEPAEGKRKGKGNGG